MPRKRKATVTRRPGPKLPEGNEGKALTKEQRLAKLEIILADYDMHVKEDIKEIEENANATKKRLTFNVMVALNQLPKEIKEMDIKSAFGLCEKSVPDAETQLTDFEHNLNLKIKSRYQMNTINENEVLEDKKSEQIREHVPNNSRALRSSKRLINKNFSTPLNSSRAMFDTPMVTPKFDPRLPITPGAKAMKPGQVIMTLAGSPVLGFDSISVKTDNGVRSMSINPQTAFLDLENESKESLLNLTQYMQRFIKDKFGNSMEQI